MALGLEVPASFWSTRMSSIVLQHSRSLVHVWLLLTPILFEEMDLKVVSAYSNQCSLRSGFFDSARSDSKSSNKSPSRLVLLLLQGQESVDSKLSVGFVKS